MCGIFGQATNNPKKINQANIKILGMFNESRGRNSCGISYDGEIFHGLDKEALFTDFIKGRNFKVNKYPIAIGHTRQSSVGAINHFNCHPFGFGLNKKDDTFETIFVHNGTLLNHKELAFSHKIETTEYYTNQWNHEMTRNKIDSEILGEILHTSKKFKVLSEYNGRAALVWTNTYQPNVIYLWSGKSVPEEHDKPELAEEERPLNVYLESKNNFYFSSIPESLHAIGGTEKNTFQIDYNTVYVVTDGDFKNAEKFKVSRSKNYHIETYNYSHYTRGGNYNACEMPSQSSKHSKYDFFKKKVNNNSVIPLPSAKVELPPINIYLDNTIHNQNHYGGKIYTKKLRYYKNGHPVNGVYVWFYNHGLYFMGDNEKEALAKFHMNAGKKFVDGEFTDTKTVNGYIPFADIEKIPTFHYIIEGVMLKTKLDYDVTRANIVKGLWFDYIKLSYMSIHPVIDLNIITTDSKNQGIYKDGKLYTGVVTGLAFEKKYHIENGNLTKTELTVNGVTSTTPKKKEGEIPDHVFYQTKHFLITNEQRICENEYYLEGKLKEIVNGDSETIIEENGQVLSHDEISQLVFDIINEELTDPLISMQDCMKKLEVYKSHPDAKDGIEMLNQMMKLLNTFVTEK